ncbi:MAG: hypothetical protein J07HX5_01403 [halophilic archaeon J07HX5]|jgi:hypothetical protein|nr:MAG: hypothetical protein J07HX5_01403 [halophilic archaeon J07HX5]
MTHPRQQRLARVRRALRDRGFELEDNEQPGADGVVATGGQLPESQRPPTTPLAVTTPLSTEPLEIVSALDNAATQERVPLLVAAPESATAIRELLAAPSLLAGRNRGRLFYGVADRILLQEGGYACVAADRTATLQWHERATQAETDTPGLVLTVDETPQLTLASVATLRCPGPAAADVPYRYVRAEAGQFRVLAGDTDTPVGRYESTVAMRADGYRPVPLPLVPEHHIRTNGRYARSVVLATVSENGVQYEQPMRSD